MPFSRQQEHWWLRLREEARSGCGSGEGGKRSDYPRSHHRQLGRPEVVRDGIVRPVRNPRVKEGLRQRPAAIGTDALRQGLGLESGSGPEGLFGSMKKVLFVLQKR